MSERQALLMLFPGFGVEPARFDAALGANGGIVAQLLPADALPSLAHATGMDPALPPALLTVQEDSLDAAVASLWPLIDPQRSTLLVFERHAILPGHDAIRLFFGLRRLERLSHDQFCDYWLNRHAALGRRLIPPYSYHQLHGDPQATQNAASRIGLPGSTLDGVVEVHFPDVATLVRQLSRAEVAEEALADEKNFIDHARSLFWAYREEEPSA